MATQIRSRTISSRDLHVVETESYSKHLVLFLGLYDMVLLFVRLDRRPALVPIPTATPAYPFIQVVILHYDLDPSP